MGNARSGAHRKKDLLDDSSWLKKIVHQYQKSRNCGVSSFNDFSIEKINGEDERQGFQVYRVSVSFKNESNKPRKAHWIIKLSQNDALSTEIRIHTHLLADVYKYLSCRSNVRVRYLLNVPEMILSEQIKADTSSQKNLPSISLALILEDLTKTKSCVRANEKEIICGLELAQFRLFLGTLAQFHAVGFAWSTSFGDDSLLDSHPYLHRSSSKEDLEPLFDRYEAILAFAERTKMFSDMPRRKELFAALRKNSTQLLNFDVLQDLSSPICSLCLGAPVPSDVYFHYETPLSASSFLNEQDEGGPSPICAAVSTCSRIHFGNVVREVATSFFTLPSPVVRTHYLTFMLQNYCQAFTLTSELLEVNTRKRLNLSFEDFLTEFYDFVPHGMLRAVVMHMRRSLPSEVQGLSSRQEGQGVGSFDEKSYFIPLSDSRIRFLVSLLNPLKRCA